MIALWIRDSRVNEEIKDEQTTEKQGLYMRLQVESISIMTLSVRELIVDTYIK